MIRRLAIAASAAALLVAGCAPAGPPRTAGGRDQPLAEPSRVVAAELAFARLAQEKGQWTAFIETSDDDAVMFVPEPVNADDWLRRQTNPAQAVRWQPHQVWSSCDGTLAATKGAWQRPDGTVGYFTTVWARQRNGEYEWVLDQGDTLEQPLAAPEFVEAKAAECDSTNRPMTRRERERYRPAILRPAACDGTLCSGGGTSADGTLAYAYAVTPQGRQVTVQMRQSGAMAEVLRSDVAAE